MKPGSAAEPIPAASISKLCDVCGSQLRLRFARVRDPYSEEYFSIFGCESCGLGLTWPAPADLAGHYPERYYIARHGVSAGFCIRRRMKWIERACRAGGAKKLLDVGCGEGDLLFRARQHGWQVAGVELRRDEKSAGVLDIRGSLEAATELAPFDCITCWHSLEHFPDPASLLRQIRASLKPDGALLLAVPNARGLQARTMGRHWMHLDAPRHLWHFSDNSLRVLLGQCGFTVQKTWQQEFEYDLLGWVQSALNIFLSQPNVLYSMVTRKPRAAGLWQRAASWTAAPLLTVAAAPAVWVSTAFGSGGTLVVLARTAALAGPR